MNNEGDVGQKKQNGRNGKSLSFSLIKKEPSFSFFSVSSKEGKQTYWGGGQKIKLIVCLSLTPSFF